MYSGSHTDTVDFCILRGQKGNPMPTLLLDSFTQETAGREVESDFKFGPDTGIDSKLVVPMA